MVAKLTDNMVKALASATHNASEKREGFTGWEIMTPINARTRKGMHDRGLMHEHYYLTDAGVSAMAAQNGMGALTTPAPAVESTPTVPDAQNATESVVIQGGEPNTWAPDFSAATARECYFGCGVAPVAVFVDYVGRTEGLCAEHRNRAESTTYDVPDNGSETDIKEEKNVTDSPLSNAVALIRAIQGGAIPVAGVIQNRAGMSGATHYHSPVCADVKREMNYWGQTKDDVFYSTFKSVAEILTFEYGDIASDSAEIDTPEWWSEILFNATFARSNSGQSFGVKIMPCLDIPAGRAGKGPLVTDGGFYRVGFDQPSPEKMAEIRAESLRNECKANHTAGTVCKACEEIAPVALTATGCPWPSGIHAMDNGTCTRCGFTNNTDAGFVEVLTTKEYDLSVIVDESTGASVSLGWVTLTLAESEADDLDAIADAYGKAHGSGTPRDGWASIIIVHDVCDL